MLQKTLNLKDAKQSTKYCNELLCFYICVFALCDFALLDVKGRFLCAS